MFFREPLYSRASLGKSWMNMHYESLFHIMHHNYTYMVSYWTHLISILRIKKINRSTEFIISFIGTSTTSSSLRHFTSSGWKYAQKKSQYGHIVSVHIKYVQVKKRHRVKWVKPLCRLISSQKHRYKGGNENPEWNSCYLTSSDLAYVFCFLNHC